MNRIKFFETINKSLFGGRLTARQRAGIECKLDAFDAYDVPDHRWRAYMLATSYHETAATMQPIEEYGKGKGQPYGRKQKKDGSVYTYPDQIYYGRGDVQLTWYENYRLMGQILGIDLLWQPELALRSDISARIMIEGMTRGCSGRGDFTGVSLENYFNGYKDDPVNARRVVNGLDCAQRIAGYHKTFLNAFKVALMSVLLFFAGCMPSKTVAERVIAQTDSAVVSVTTDSLWRIEAQAAQFARELRRIRNEDMGFSSEAHIHEIHYDTRAPVDSSTGRHPISLEIVATTGSSYGKQVEDVVTRRAGAEVTQETLLQENSSQLVDVDMQTADFRVLKETVEAPRRQFKLVWIGVVLGLIIALVVIRYRCVIFPLKKKK